MKDIFGSVYKSITKYTHGKIFACWFFIIPAGLYGFYSVKRLKDRKRGEDYVNQLKEDMELRKQYELLRGRKILSKDS